MNLHIKQDLDWKDCPWYMKPYYWNLILWLILGLTSLLIFLLDKGYPLKEAWDEIFDFMGWLPEEKKIRCEKKDHLCPECYHNEWYRIPDMKVYECGNCDYPELFD